MCELPQALLQIKPRARKCHKCCECRGTIEAGELYHRTSGIWDGQPGSYAVCLDCDALRAEVDKGITDPAERTAFGYLGESVVESCSFYFASQFVAIQEKRGAKVYIDLREQAAGTPK